MNNSTIKQLTDHEDSEILHLNLSSTSKNKIHVLYTLYRKALQNLDRFSKLTSLILNNQMIQKIQNLSSLTNLKVLNLQFNRIKVLQNLDNLGGLQQLYLSYNCIRNVRQKLELLPSLRILHIAYNELTIDHLSNLSSALNITILSLHGNPITKQISYHTLLGLVFSKLVVLDEKEVRRVDVDIMTEQVTFMRGALNEVIRQKNQILAEAQKMKKELTEHAQTKVQQNRKDEEKEEKIFYIENLAEQNKILQGKIAQVQESIHQIKSRQISHQQSIRVGQHLQQQTILQQLSIQLQKKYSQSLQLERKLEKLKDKTGPQKQKLLRKLIENETIINSCHQQSKDLIKVVQVIRHLSMGQQVQGEEEGRQEEGEADGEDNQISLLLTQAKKYKQKIEENSFLIKKYREGLKENDEYDSQVWQAIFGEMKDQYDETNIKNIIEKYPNGLLPTVLQLLALTFGKYVPIETIQQLRRRLNDTPLVKIAAQYASKTKNQKNQQNQKRFLTQKEYFIRQFQRQINQLAEQWKALELQKKNTEDELNLIQQEFYKDLQIKKKLQQERFQRQQKRFQQLQIQHKKTLSTLADEQIFRKRQLQQTNKQIQQVQIEFDKKFEQLQEFQKHFSELKAQKENLNVYHNQIQRMKSQLSRLSNFLEQKEKQIQDTQTQQELLKDRIDILQKKTKERLNSLLQINEKIKQTQLKLSKIVTENNEISDQISIKENTIRVLNDEIKDYQRNTERARLNFNSWEEKIINLQALEASCKITLSQLQLNIAKQQQIHKSRSKLNEQLLLKRQRLNEQLNHYQQKLAQSKTSLDSLTNLNNSISKMSLHHKELKSSLMELQIQVQTQIKQKLNLQLALKDMRQQQINLIGRLHCLKIV